MTILQYDAEQRFLLQQQLDYVVWKTSQLRWRLEGNNGKHMNQQERSWHHTHRREYRLLIKRQQYLITLLERSESRDE